MSRSVMVSSCFGLGSRDCFSDADTDGMLCKCSGGLWFSSPLLFNVNELGATCIHKWEYMYFRKWIKPCIFGMRIINLSTNWYMINGPQCKKTCPGFANNIGADQPAHGLCYLFIVKYIKTCVKRPLSKRQKIGFQDQLSLNAGQKYCGTLQREHSAILSTFMKLPVVIKTFIFSIFEWPFYTYFTVSYI